MDERAEELRRLRDCLAAMRRLAAACSHPEAWAGSIRVTQEEIARLKNEMWASAAAGRAAEARASQARREEAARLASRARERRPVVLGTNWVRG